MEKIKSDFTSVLKNVNESFDQNYFEFRSLESNSIKVEKGRKSGSAKDKSYSEEVKAFIQRVIERRKIKDENFTHVNSSTPFKMCNSNEIDISGIAYLDVKKIQSLNDSDFESMEQDNYDDSKENIEIDNKINENRRKSLIFGGTPKSSKKTKNSRISPHKSRKWKKFTKIKLRKYLMTNDDDSFLCAPPSSDNDEGEKFSSNYIAFNTSLDFLTEQLHLAPPPCDAKSNMQCTPMNGDCESNNDSLCEFAFSHPNMTKTSEASIKNLSQLSVSKEKFCLGAASE
jgi:tRNA splicing endonuclease